MIFQSLIESSTDHVVSAPDKTITIEIVTDMRNDFSFPLRKQFSPRELLSWTAKSVICALVAAMTDSLRARGGWRVPQGLCSDIPIATHELGVSDVLAGPPGRDALGFGLSLSLTKNIFGISIQKLTTFMRFFIVPEVVDPWWLVSVRIKDRRDRLLHCLPDEWAGVSV